MQYSFNPLKFAPDQALKSNHKRASSWQRATDAEARQKYLQGMWKYMNIPKQMQSETILKQWVETV